MVVDDRDDEATSLVFHALADATRRDILRRAVTGGESVSGLAEHYPMSFAAVQKHVAVLERAGLVTKHRDGRRALVRTNPHAVRSIRETLGRLENEWFGRVDRMARLLSHDSDTDHDPKGPVPMTVTDIDRDFDNLTLTITADFDAPIEQVWDLWADPRKLERWWGPPTYPATVEDHDLTPGGDVTYYMTSPEGDKYRGWWRVDAVEAPTALNFSDGFADADGKPVDDMPVTTNRMRLTARAGGTRMELRAHFDTREQMDQLDKMGMTEGMTLAMGQMDAILAG